MSAQDRPPNIVYIMSDELAYFELGHMGNPYIKTPHIDRMAKEGLRFTNALAASSVCGPLRGCMLTGKHAGHASVRENDGGTPLRAEEETIASVLKQKDCSHDTDVEALELCHICYGLIDDQVARASPRITNQFHIGFVGYVLSDWLQ